MKAGAEDSEIRLKGGASAAFFRDPCKPGRPHDPSMRRAIKVVRLRLQPGIGHLGLGCLWLCAFLSHGLRHEARDDTENPGLAWLHLAACFRSQALRVESLRLGWPRIATTKQAESCLRFYTRLHTQCACVCVCMYVYKTYHKSRLRHQFTHSNSTG